MHLSIVRHDAGSTDHGADGRFVVSVHEEGTGITWQRNVSVSETDEQELLDATAKLYLWSRNLAHSPHKADAIRVKLGQRLYDIFMGTETAAALGRPTALLIDVDETILNLPWEVMIGPKGPLAFSMPVGRLVTTRVLPKPARDPVEEDAVVNILVVDNPTGDLGPKRAEIKAINKLAGHGVREVRVKILPENQATRAGFIEIIDGSSYDILHFAGHAYLDRKQPGQSAMSFADGMLRADDILELPWKKAPYIVFNSSCESGRAVGGKRLVSAENNANGLAAAFIAAGVRAYAGYFWPVTNAGASMFASTFYQALFERENVGLGFMLARQHVAAAFKGSGDLTAYSVILFGDAATKHRQDLAMANNFSNTTSNDEI